MTFRILLRQLGLENPLRPLRREAEAGEAEAQFFLAEAYFRGGETLPRDEDEAVKWLKKSAENDFPEAQAKLGSLFWSGQGGLSKDLTKAEWWLRRAEQNGHHEAIVSIALLHHSSFDGSEDCLPALSHAESYDLHKKGAELNISFCQDELATLYFEGKGIPQNLVYARAWYQIASENGRQVWDFRWKEMDDRMSLEEKAQAARVTSELREYIKAGTSHKKSLKRNSATKPWLKKAQRLKKKSKTYVSEAELLLRQADSVERRIAYLAEVSCVLATTVPVIFLIGSLLPYTLTKENIGFTATITIVSLFVIKYLMDALYWRIYKKGRVVARYLDLFKRSEMPNRLYYHDDISDYISNIIDASSGYDASVLTPKVISVARDIQTELRWRSVLQGGSGETRFIEAVDMALEAYSPREEAPPFTLCKSLCEWLNQAQLEQIERLGSISRREARTLYDARPFSNQWLLYSFLRKMTLVSTTPVQVYVELEKASAEWVEMGKGKNQ